MSRRGGDVQARRYRTKHRNYTRDSTINVCPQLSEYFYLATHATDRDMVITVASGEL